LCRAGDGDTIAIDSSDSDEDANAAVNGRSSTLSVTCPSIAWDLSRAALQVQQMIEPRYRTSPLGNNSVFS